MQYDLHETDWNTYRIVVVTTEGTRVLMKTDGRMQMGLTEQ